MRLNPRPSAAPASREPVFSTDGARSTGRGGSGNMAPAVRAEKTIMEEDEIERAETCNAGAIE
jgi:Protein of unknown function (DUF3602)